jgi:uncharacterized protein YndB with AHSA1/START domain
MAHNERRIGTSPERVWDVLADGWLYPLWVVGATRMREVDDTWPAVDSRLHHSVGSWPVLVDDTTSVLECTPHSLLRLRARAWPTGDAHVTIQLSGAGADTLVEIDEDAASGPALLVPKPARDLGLHWRNVESLRRLAFLAERRADPARP